jgi:predicted Abi (CAAX) family protease
MSKEITAKSDFWGIVLLIILAIVVVWLFFLGGLDSVTEIFSQ